MLVETQGTLKEPSMVGEECRWDFNPGRLDFTLGKYRVGPFEARVRLHHNHLNPLSATWTGVSITSFNADWGQGETDSDDFMYWLWYHRGKDGSGIIILSITRVRGFMMRYDWYIGITGRRVPADFDCHSLSMYYYDSEDDN